MANGLKANATGNGLRENKLRESALKTSTNPTRNLVYRDKYDVLNQDEDRVYRWVSRQLVDKNMGYHPRGWTVLNKENEKGEISVFGSKKGKPAYIPMNGLVLAFKTREDHEEEMQVMEGKKISIEDAARGHVGALQRLGKNAHFEQANILEKGVDVMS